ncbi:hypothetical protein B0H14DRAFT_1430674 [Mycena olivaceomarginata]|nr:hypothetical protein B0H14DRAFT_1430674 [Mycena olivaceomarginata]
MLPHAFPPLARGLSSATPSCLTTMPLLWLPPSSPCRALLLPAPRPRVTRHAAARAPVQACRPNPGHAQAIPQRPAILPSDLGRPSHPASFYYYLRRLCSSPSPRYINPLAISPVDVHCRCQFPATHAPAMLPLGLPPPIVRPSLPSHCPAPCQGIFLFLRILLDPLNTLFARRACAPICPAAKCTV